MIRRKMVRELLYSGGLRVRHQVQRGIRGWAYFVFFPLQRTFKLSVITAFRHRVFKWG